MKDPQWKEFSSPDKNHPTKCRAEITQLMAFAVISTRTSHEKMTDAFRIFAYASSPDNESRQIEVFCVHDDVSAIEVKHCFTKRTFCACLLLPLYL